MKILDSNELLEISFKKIYDERDPNLKSMFINDSNNKFLNLPAYINE